MVNLGSEIIQVCRTVRFGSGWRSVWYLPKGISVPAIEDVPIPAGPYFLSPDDTGRFRNWVIESEIGTRNAHGRTHIEVHIGRTLDASAGCFCPGMYTNEAGVANSAPAIEIMRDALDRNDPDPPVWFINITEPS